MLLLFALTFLTLLYAKLFLFPFLVALLFILLSTVLFVVFALILMLGRACLLSLFLFLLLPLLFFLPAFFLLFFPFSFVLVSLPILSTGVVARVKVRVVVNVFPPLGTGNLVPAELATWCVGILLAARPDESLRVFGLVLGRVLRAVLGIDPRRPDL